MSSITKTASCDFVLSVSPCFAILIFVFTSPCVIANDWSTQIKLESSFLNYHDSDVRDSAYTIGGQVHLDFLEKMYFLTGYRYSHVDALANNLVNMEEIQEDLFFIGAQYNFYSDILPGKYGLRVDAYYGEMETFFTIFQEAEFQGRNRKPASSVTMIQDNDFASISPVLSYTNYLKTLYFDFVFAFSDYGDFSVNQFSPAFGFAFNARKNWMLFRGHFIEQEKNFTTVYGKNNTAIEVSWTHWLGLNAPLGLNSFGASILAGERIYALDPDANQVFTFADLQKGSVAFFFQWQPNELVQILIQAGSQKFEDKVIGDNYSSKYAYVNLSRKW